MQILLTYSSLLLPHTPLPTLDHVEHKKLGKTYFIVIFQFFEIFNFENNVLLWKDFGIWNILLRIDLKKKISILYKVQKGQPVVSSYSLQLLGMSFFLPDMTQVCTLSK